VLITPHPDPTLPAPWRYRLPGTGAALAWLAQHGWGVGTRLGLGPANTAAGAALINACIVAGVVVVPFNRRLHADELRRQVAQARLDGLAADADHPLAALGAITIPAYDNACVSWPMLGHVAETAPALVLFTSGTTAAAKPVRLSRRAIAAAAMAATERLALTPADLWLGCLPPDHIGGISIILRAMVSGCRLWLLPRFDEAAVTAACDQGATGVSVVPTMLHRLIMRRGDQPWSPTLRRLLTGGGPLSADLIARCTALGLAPCQTYGLTEAASQVCTLAPAEAAAHPGSAGRPVRGMAVAIRDDAGHDLPTGATGRIWISGDSLCDGYEDDRLDVRTPARGTDGPLWFPTGDLGSLDANGFLTVVGRHDDVIVSGGENIAPAEIEAVLERHPAIREAGVYALPDAEWGQVVIAALVPHDHPIVDAELEAFLIAHLSRFKRPRRWRWVAELPRTASGKLQRTRLGAIPHASDS
jgi:O-succinylbenzoic acid--CoA ligase